MGGTRVIFEKNKCVYFMFTLLIAANIEWRLSALTTQQCLSPGWWNDDKWSVRHPALCSRTPLNLRNRSSENMWFWNKKHDFLIYWQNPIKKNILDRKNILWFFTVLLFSNNTIYFWPKKTLWILFKGVLRTTRNHLIISL